MNDYYRRNLPHIQPAGGEFFCTFRLVNSLPKEALEQYWSKRKEIQKALKENSVRQEKLRKLRFVTFDNLLSNSDSGNFWLRKKEIAQTVADKLFEYDSEKYQLLCYCIMPNHVHLLIKLNKRDKSRSTKIKYPLTKILKLIKGGTAFECNKILDRNGQFWQHESYDHLVRNDKERDNIIRYILQNPVKAGLVKYWKDWEWSFCKEGYLPIK